MRVAHFIYRHQARLHILGHLRRFELAPGHAPAGAKAEANLTFHLDQSVVADHKAQQLDVPFTLLAIADEVSK